MSRTHAYYNENDAHAAQWLRALCDAGLIAPGTVDERSIKDVGPGDADATHAHFFAGIGGWDLALQLAGWPGGWPIWTGSCPCQPFSIAGRGRGTADKRHLWPEWFRLIRECRPPVVVGEQVASPAGRTWLNAVFADLEGVGYACAGADLCAAGIGAPHIRQRLYWVAILPSARRQGWQHREDRGQEIEPGRRRVSFGVAYIRGARLEKFCEQPARSEREAVERGEQVGRVAHDQGSRWGQGSADGGRGILGASTQRSGGGLANTRCAVGLVLTDGAGPQQGRQGPEAAGHRGSIEPAGGAVRMGHAGGAGGGWDTGAVLGPQGEGPEQGFGARRVPDEFITPGVVGGPWAGAEWWLCRDGKARPAKPGAFPLAASVSGRVAVVRPGKCSASETPEAHWYSRAGALRGIGNAIVPPLAAEFLRTVMEILT